MITRFINAAVTVAIGVVGSVVSTHVGACTFSGLRTASTGAQAEIASEFVRGLNMTQLTSPQNAGTSAENSRFLTPRIVGFWKFAFTAPDGVTSIDWGFQTWHDDGTEITNSGGHPAEFGNFCMGAWEFHGGGQYSLNHWAISWGPPPDFDPTVFGGLVNIRELVTVDRSGNSMSGTVTLDLYAEDGITLLAHLGNGTVSGKRITP